MSAFDIRVHGAIVDVILRGNLHFDETNASIAAAASAAREARTNKVLFDLRQADLANYYSYTVRHGELAPRLGLDTSFVLAFVSHPDAIDVAQFMEQVAINRGWRARAFTDFAAAEKWLGASPSRPVVSPTNDRRPI